MVASPPKRYNLAIIGASGNTGSKVLDILIERDFPYNQLFAVTSGRSAGNVLQLQNGLKIKSQTISEVDFSAVDIAFFCAGSTVSQQYAHQVAQQGCVVIDKTSFFRMKDDIPLIVPEANIEQLKIASNSGIISSPNCVATPLSMALKAVNNRGFKINKVVVSTYQSVSGAGREAVKTLHNQIQNHYNQSDDTMLKKSIAFNVVPQIDVMLDNGYTGEELKVMEEVKKILSLPDLDITATCVRVPTLVGHAMSVYLEIDENPKLEDVRNALVNFNGVRLCEGDCPPTPKDSDGVDAAMISRLRNAGQGCSFWLVSDNLRKGAALNGVQIAEHLINIDPSLKKFQLKGYA